MADYGEDIEYSYTINELNSLLTASYRWDITQDWVLDALIGNELVEKKTQHNYSYGANFNFPGWNNLNNASSYLSDKSYKKKRTVGNFANPLHRLEEHGLPERNHP